MRLVNLVLLAAMGMFLAGCGINNIPTYEQAMKTRWRDVQNNYQRRADFAPRQRVTLAI